MKTIISKLELCGNYLPDSTKFAFIGQLQSNKINKLIKAGSNGNLVRVETVQKVETVEKLSKAVCSNWDLEVVKPLEIMVQIDTSGEDSKGGIPFSDISTIADVVSEVVVKDGLKFVGLMTIGAPGDITAFDKLVSTRSLLTEHEDTGLSMGMSGDYKEAVEKGSTEIRCGSNIFGARDYANKK